MFRIGLWDICYVLSLRARRSQQNHTCFSNVMQVVRILTDTLEEPLKETLNPKLNPNPLP